MWRRWMSLLSVLSVLALASFVAAADEDGKEKRKGKGKGKGRPTPEAIFKKMDANGDGKVSKEEFMKFHDELFARLKEKAKDKFKDKGKGKGRDRKEVLERRFKRVDANGDGSISSEEWANAVKEMREKGKRFKGKLDPSKIEQIKRKRQKKEPQ